MNFPMAKKTIINFIKFDRKNYFLIIIKLQSFKKLSIITRKIQIANLKNSYKNFRGKIKFQSSFNFYTFYKIDSQA